MMTNLKHFTTEAQRHRGKQQDCFIEYASLRGEWTVLKYGIFLCVYEPFSVSLMKLLAIRLRLAKAPAKSLVMCLCGGFL